MRFRTIAAMFALLAGGVATAAHQPLDADSLRARVQAEGEVRLGASGLLIQRYDFTRPEGAVEAVVVRPEGGAPRPAIVLVPGFSRTAYDMLPVAVRLAREGFVPIAVTQPGFGASAGPADFAGPRTYAALPAAAERFAAEPYVDRARRGIYGYPRGGLAAAPLAGRTDLFRAAVLGGGIYDFEAAFRQVSLPGIVENMRAEAGDSAEAIRFRSPIHDLEGLDGPVLIVHGENDANAPLGQARALAARLAELGREDELIDDPGRDHALAVADIVVPAAAFFRRHLAAPPAAGE